MQFSSLKHVFSSLQTQEALLTMLLDSKTSTDSPRYSSDIATRASHAKDSLHSTKQRLEEIKIHAQRCIETFTAALTHLHGLYTDFMKACSPTDSHLPIFLSYSSVTVHTDLPGC
uniref:Uncharacterized protein n=1 Tax=Lygus hesperus TaxID=30085 RepID=A0A0A9X726_LYGHE